MNEQVAKHQRRLVIITDPHIKADDNNFVFRDGIKLQQQLSHSQIFVSDCNNQTFFGKCWPGNSVWVDFLNEDAQKYWEELFSYDKFKGLTQIYSSWNDMNEPSVFETEQGTFPF